MSSRSSTFTGPIYPHYCFRGSPTYNAWVKLTAADVHTLRQPDEFTGRNTYFALNHPIRYVCIVGTIVAIEDLFSKYVLLTVDDSSGATIEIKITRLAKEIADAIDCPSNTVVANVNVRAELGIFDVFLDGSILDIGTIIKAKGTIMEFRKTKQLDLKRASIIQTTNEEVEAWSHAAEFKDNVLSKPWRLTVKDQECFRAEEMKERQKALKQQNLRQEHQERKEKRLSKHKAKLAVYEERQEREFRKLEKKYDEGALI